MTNATVIDLMRSAFLTTFWLSLPMLAVGFVAGVVFHRFALRFQYEIT